MSSLPSSAITDARWGYQRPLLGYDEAVDEQTQTRTNWHEFFHSVEDLGQPEFGRRWRDAQRMIRDNGVTYNVYGDPRGTSRPWQLDPIPLMLSAADASQLEAGLQQRARLFDAILTDIYGPQRLLREGLVPPELIFPNPGFLRSCHGIKLPKGRFLHLYAANLGRESTGQWQVLGDRTQAPSGAGYALENRIVMSRTLPEAFRDCRVDRLARFFQSFRDMLRSISHRNQENPRIVLLTPGPYNETYFEHAYLARYLGYTLVEGGDLTCRDNRVFLKVLGGLQPVDVILRRLDDDYCDPLELRPDSSLGIPGLTHAVRTGNVTVANALGTGLLESPVWLALLPTLCRKIFGEDLRLESVNTWWCGQPDSLQYTLDHLNDLVIKPAFNLAGNDPVFPADLSRDERGEFMKKIQTSPYRYVAQQRLNLSTAPVWTGTGLDPRKLVVRIYLTATPDGFSMMPGGLTRVGATGDSTVVSMQRGGGSKDTWVTSVGPVSEFSLLPQGSRLDLTRAGGDLPSRAADNLFWLGRYAERSESLARLLRGIATRLAERTGVGDTPELNALIDSLDLLGEDTKKFRSEGDAEAVLIAAVFDADNPNTLVSVLRNLRRVASIVRDRISFDMWRIVNGLSQITTEPLNSNSSEEPTASDILELLNRTIIHLSAFDGLVVESMTRGESWRFLDMGRRIERSVHTIALLRGSMICPYPHESPILDAILEVADSGMTYRRRYMNSVRSEGVIDLIILDDTNPRSLASQLIALHDDVNNLPRMSGQAGLSAEQRIVLSALSMVQLAEAFKLAESSDGKRPLLIEMLAKLDLAMPAISDVITQQYLTHLQPSRHLAANETLRPYHEMGEPL